MCKTGNEQALLNCCAVDHQCFRELLAHFEPVHNTFTVDRCTGKIERRSFCLSGKPKGRKRELDATGALGLVLFWCRTRGCVQRAIQLCFGSTASMLCEWLRFSRRCLLFALLKHPAARINPPTEDDVDQFGNAMGLKHPLLQQEGVHAACNGLKLPIEQSQNFPKQNPLCNGWTGGTCINSVFVFSPDELICMATFNAPGSWHDSTIADHGICKKMRSVHNRCGGEVVVDSAFNLTSADCLIQSSQVDPILKDATCEESCQAKRLNNQAASLRQLSVHGMRMIQGQFPGLKDHMQHEEAGERKIAMHLMILLCNCQTAQVGINQILNTFMSRTKGFPQRSFAHCNDAQELVIVNEHASIFQFQKTFL